MVKELNLVDIIGSKSNNSFRTVIDADKDGYIFDAQISAAKEIVSELARKTTRSHHVLLLAKMQSGKTGTCNAVVNIINQTKLNIFMGIDKYMFITGMNDCGLKEQTYERVKQQIIGASSDNIYTSPRSKRNLSPNKFFVMKNSDLMKYDGDVNNTLIFIDESHYGSNERNVLTKFLNKQGIDWKDSVDLIKRNIYIVSVSATPFSEIISDKAECKKMIELKTDSEYVGVTQYLKNDLVFDADKEDFKNGAIFDYIADAKARMDADKTSGVMIIRTRNFNTIEDNPEIAKDFDFVELKSAKTNIEYAKLNERINVLITNNEFNKRMRNVQLSNGKTPKLAQIRPLIVLIKGAFRAGITLPSKFKDYIYMIYDYSLKADTTAQALLGRMCGYRHASMEDFKHTHFFLNKKFADMYSEWENDFQNREIIPFNKAKWAWVDKNFEGETQIASKSCGNIAIELTDDEIRNIYEMLAHKRNKLAIMENVFPQIIKDKNLNIPYDYMEEVLMGGKNNYKKSSQDRRFNAFTSDLLVYPFRADKIKKFAEDTDRDYLTHDDLGKKCVSLVLDAEIYKNTDNTIEIKGNKRLLVYYAEVAQKALMANRDGMYQVHKDTTLA